MPTGYTAVIGEGISFQNFALLCARAFGHLIKMRDCPLSAQIPEEFYPVDYSERAQAMAVDRMEKLKVMEDAECTRMAKVEYDKQVYEHKDGISRQETLKARYEAMLAEVEAWTPPSPDHEGLKRFMREQITDSIRFDCCSEYHQNALKELRLMTGEEWRQAGLSRSLEEIASYSKAQQEENERTAATNKWVRQLRESI